MNEMFKTEEPKRGFSPLFVGGVIAALVFIGISVWILSFKPSMEDQTDRILQGSYHEGTPEFAELNKDIIISTDENTVESPTGMGTISMYIRGNAKNKGTRNITVLEVNVGVITQQNQVLKEKRVLVVPTEQPHLGPDETIPITLSIDGFDRRDDRASIRWKVTAIKAE
jgi:hypothetical protein